MERRRQMFTWKWKLMGIWEIPMCNNQKILEHCRSFSCQGDDITVMLLISFAAFEYVTLFRFFISKYSSLSVFDRLLLINFGNEMQLFAFSRHVWFVDVLVLGSNMSRARLKLEFMLTLVYEPITRYR